MFNKKPQPFTFIIRASGEATVEKLQHQLSKQISGGDQLITLDDEVSFEEKLRQGYEMAIKVNNKLSIFIDGDILLRGNAVKRIRSISEKLDESDFGFGLRLWDRFYNQPKFRGLHIYNTKFLGDALKYIPRSGEQKRPESFVKEKMREQGYRWRNDISFYVAGIHDFYQNPQDIYYKFLVRSKRSPHDISKLKTIFQDDSSIPDYKIALQGLNDGETIDKLLNNKYLYHKNELKFEQSIDDSNQISDYIDLLIIRKLIRYYKFNSIFWKSI